MKNISQCLLAALFVMLLLPAWVNNGNSAIAAADPDSAGNSSSSTNSILTFTRIATDVNETQYLLGEVSNKNANASIEAAVYFGKSGPQSAYYADYVGLVGPGMGIPFKLPVTIGSIHLNMSDAKVESLATLGKSNESLSVDYNTLVMDKRTHAISGEIDNNSPYDSFGIKVMAIAMGSHSQILDVVQSKPIDIAANGSAQFVLVPMASVASQVASYSCFVPGQSGMNVTLAAEDGNSLQLEVFGDTKVRNIKYDTSAHAISFDGQGIFPGGGFATLMIISGPPSIMNSTLAVAVNGQNDTKALVSTLQVYPGTFYKHVEIGLPFGRNSVVISALSSAPEFPSLALAMVVAVASALVATRLARAFSSTQTML